MRILLALIAANGLPPDIAAPSNDALSGTLGRSCRTNIEIEDGLVVFVRLFLFARVVVDDVSDFLAFAIHLS